MRIRNPSHINPGDKNSSSSLDLTERKQADELVAQQSEHLHILYEASQRLYRTLDLDEIYHTICDFMSIIAPNDGFIISAFAPESKLITCRAYWMENEWLDVSTFPPIPLEEEGRGTQSIAIRTGQAMLLNDYQAQQKTAQTIYYVNNETMEISKEVSPDEEITRSALIVPLKIRGVVTGVIQVMSYRQNAYTENQLKLLEALALHIASAEQNALLYAQVQTELSERKLAEAALSNSLSLIEATLESIDNGILVIAADGSVTKANARFAEMWRIPADVIACGDDEKMMSLILVQLSDPDSFVARVKQLYAHPKTDSFDLISFKDGRIFERVSKPMFIAGEPQGRVWSFFDITERKQAEESIRTDQIELQRLLTEMEQSRQALLSVVEDQKEAEEQVRQLNTELEQRVKDRTAQLAAANQELQAFSYSVSHDLRAPLRAMDGFSGALMEDYYQQLDEQARHYLSRIQEASRSMGQLIDDLLNLSRITRAEYTRQRVDLSAVARKIVAELQTQNPNRSLQFEISANLEVDGDANLLKIVLENLLNNAVKFTGQRQQAYIQFGVTGQAGVRSERSERIYFVRDNGAGFDMTYASKLFAPFQRLHGMQEFPGTGIGLTIVQRIITRHGGRIWPDAAVDQGATFYFTLGDAG
jgi:signal transduction histidine kinase/GAF domain-containing protein